MKRTFHFRFSIVSIVSLLFITQSSCQFIDDGGLSGVSGSTSAKFAAGVAGTSDNNMAKGVIKSAENTLGLFMKNQDTTGSLENARMLARGSSVYGDAYLGIAQEDVFYYSRTFNQKKFAAGQDVDLELLTIASRCKILMTLYTKDVYLLVNTASGITSLSDLKSKAVNVGTLDSETYLTAYTVLTANSIDCTMLTNDAATGIANVVSGKLDAAFYVDTAKSSVLSAISSKAAVKLIKVTMPSGSQYYAQTGSITSEDYPFMTESIDGNAQVSVVLLAGPKFSDDNVEVFIKNILDNTVDYKDVDPKWKDVSTTKSESLMIRFPQIWNYRALCYLTGCPRLTKSSVSNGFYSGYADSVTHSIAVELIWLLSHNADIDLKEQNSTGGWENAYRILTGSATMALVTDGIFSSLAEKKALYESVMGASMKKIIPMNEEYVHLVVNTTALYGTTGTSISACFGNTAKKTINIGPKTSGTFLAAVKIMNSYGFTEANNITYAYDSESDGVAKVVSGEYLAAFVTSSVPYNRFYSHDTYQLPSSGVRLIPALFNGTAPFPYREATLAGQGQAIYENYPYPKEILPEPTITTTVIRGMLVASPVFKSNDTDTYIKSIFRFAGYETVPSDSDWWALGYQPNFPWIAVRKETITSFKLSNSRTITDTVIGAREYFIKDPFGWNDQAADYYLTMF